MKVVPKKQWRYPLSLERTYAKLLVAHVQRRFKVIHAFLPEMRGVILRYAVKLDADDDNTMVNAHIDILIDQLRRAMENHTAMLPVVRRTFDQVNRYNLQEWDAVMKSVFGVPIRSQSVAAMKQDADEDDVAKLKDIWVQQNLDLISSIDDETMQKIRDRMAERIIQNVDSASLTRYLIQDIKDIARVEVNRATLIGADQVGKLNGRLSQYRQQHAGLGEYQWNSCHDSRVRPAHAARSGHVYSWGNPPPDGNPGHPIRCRCVALPVIDLDKIAIKPRKNSYIPLLDRGIMESIIKADFEDIRQYAGKLNDITVRKWYIYHDERIPDEIDTSLEIEKAAALACALRNKYRTQARDLMADQGLRATLDKEHPNMEFEELIQRKMQEKHMNRREAIDDIYKTAVKTNKTVNKILGLE